MQAEKPVSVMFGSEGDKIRGLFYKASGTGPFPTVILCHGFPGNDTDVLGLGQRLMKEGFNALAFNYRGTWGSEGIFTLGNNLEDVVSTIRYVKSGSVVQEFCVDPSRVSIIGYSHGGGMALLGSLSDPNIRRVVDVAGADQSEVARILQQSDEFRQFFEAHIDQQISNSGIRAPKTKDLIADLLLTIDKYDLVKHVQTLSSKDILIIGGWRDQQWNIPTMEHHILPLFRALQKHGAKQVQIEAFDTGHSFRDVRDQLAEKIVSWLRRNN